ncbi:MAG TPA: ABC-F family ATP-binding cassette domain-containing protein [Saprospiraceae bacterium]|nr:ABC-F family ATP-binding cassette domain-containing protein [Saprospiraceae bacterium]
MQFLHAENISKSYGEKLLFSNISLTISKGDKIALIAKNGSGKSTFLRIIAGKEGIEGEKAKLIFAKDIKIAFLDQEPVFDNHLTVLDTVYLSDNSAITALRKYEFAVLMGDHEEAHKQMNHIEDLKAWNLDAHIKEVLSKLSIHQLDQKMGELSGGQAKRVALAKILIEEPDFLILDEPTNHLDMDMIEWLEDYLSQSRLTLFMVTHDRYFLERICNTIIELQNGQLHMYNGNYSQYLEKRALRIANEETQLLKTQRMYVRELEWIRRQPKARTTKAKSRIDNFEVIKEGASRRNAQETPEFIIQSTRLGSKILELHNVGKSYSDKIILKGFSYKFKKNERVGIIGPNGSGKSTLLDLITGRIEPDQGKVVTGETIEFGYYTQEGLKNADHKRVIDVVRDIAEYIPLEKGMKLTAESLLERFLFPRSQQQVYVSQLSGGEKRRLHLLTILIKNPNFLILDEPTNDLDIITLNVLEDFLDSYKGVLVIVTHDRYFMDKLTDHLFIMEGDGEIRDFNGTYSEYLDYKSFQIKAFDKPKVEKKAIDPRTRSFEQERKELRKIEKEIENLEQRKSEINQFFLNPDIDITRIGEMSIELEGIISSLEEAELRWIELAEIIDSPHPHP